MDEEKITVVIPAFNEGHNIRKTITALRQQDQVGEIIVIDDCSQDNTVREAEQAGAKIICLQENLGKGQAIMAAYEFITNSVVILLDADLQETAPRALVLVKPVLENKADICVARFPQEKGGRGFGLVKRFSRLFVRIMSGKVMEEPLSGQRCMKKEVLGTLFPLSERFGLETGMNIDALRKGYRIIEIETELSHNPPGRDWRGIVHRLRQFQDVLQAVAARLFAPKVQER